MTDKLVIHITFFYIEDRIQYINRIIDETNKYKCTTDIFIHTNVNNLKTDDFHSYLNGKLHIMYHDLGATHPHYLSWMYRNLIKNQKDDYDVFIYIEDDMLVKWNVIEYWLKYHPKLVEKGYNLGFVRIETDNNNIEYITDLTTQKLDTFVNIDDVEYCVNTKNPYCAFWIYDKTEFQRFVNSRYFDCNNVPNYNYGIREKSAIGLHGLGTQWYTNTVIPLVDRKLIDDCKIYHMPNNYVQNMSNCFATIRFDEAVL